ncbi:sensor histidine kinase [Mucilaginibacter psychrotolerans]|uniref:histidine kinase n=1 Tax=Mucilaginibacter psychrotolerans TaxID=1524096 RepID=A0A4Y8SEF5_9SPHI|nr:HAMP domain-containing sensor histidine kinase [Mucilaginibacter psychrotolerans]TFF36844.1 sensor histidine kinase [Mucilaginibacter psychrotolerans]
MPVSFKNFLQKYTYKIIGSPEKLTLESRIFHTFSFFVLIVVMIEAFFNLYLHLYVSAGLAFGVILIQGGLYYLSRIKNKLQLAVILSAIEVNGLKAVGYYFNDGITGATLLLFAASLFILMSVSSKKLWPFLLGINIIVVASLIGSEYLYPGIIQQHYQSRADQFTDNIISYLVTVILLYVGTASIRQSYIRQKNLADEKTLALELLNAEKVKLFSIIAHDLRTPLASVQQYFTVMAEVGIDAEERAEMEKNLMETIGKTQDLLTNLLKWAKNQMNGETAYLQAVKLSPYLEETTQLFKTIAVKKEITLSTIADASITVRADPDMLQIVIRNLLNNAVKFTRPGGRIVMKAIADGPNCIISISDTGIGISRSKQADIFSLNTSSTNGTGNEGGTGLGLVLCKDYTELQGGRIWFNSVEKEGTTFYISLPLVQLQLFTG